MLAASYDVYPVADAVGTPVTPGTNTAASPSGKLALRLGTDFTRLGRIRQRGRDGALLCSDEAQNVRSAREGERWIIEETPDVRQHAAAQLPIDEAVVER